MSLSVQERFIISPWDCIPAEKTFITDNVKNRVTNRNIAVIKRTEPLASLSVRTDHIEKPEPLVFLNINPGYSNNDPASMRKPYGDGCTPTNVKRVFDYGFSSILVLNPERITKRFIKLAEYYQIDVYGGPWSFIKDGFSEKDLSPDKLDFIVCELSHMKRPIVYCGAGDGRSGVVKTAYHLSFFDKKYMVNSSRVQAKRVRVYTYLNDKFEPDEKYTKTTTAVAHAINDIRYKHPKAIERVNDVKVLENYHYFLAMKYIEERSQYKTRRYSY